MNVAWLKRQVTPNDTVPDPTPGRRRLVLSYQVSPEQSPWGYHRSSTYDNALAALALLIAGEDDLAAYILHAVARLIRADGSLWFGYNTANAWPSEESHESALVRAGALGWAGYAFAFYLSYAPPCADGDDGCRRERETFSDAATRIGEYLLSQQVSDTADRRFGLLRLGYGMIDLVFRPEKDQVVEHYVDVPATRISIENNLSAWFFLREFGRQSGESRWKDAADRVARGLEKSWHPGHAQYNRGYAEDGTPDEVLALDCGSWGALHLLAVGDPERAKRALEVTARRFASVDGKATGYRPYAELPVFESPPVNRYFFPHAPETTWNDLPLVWSEGSLGVALAYIRTGQRQRAEQVLEGLRPMQVRDSGLRYATRDVPHQMTAAPGVAGAAWLVFVAEALRGNPLAEKLWR